MKDRVDKSMGIVTRIAEALARIKPTEPLRLAKREARKKPKCSDSSGNCFQAFQYFFFSCPYKDDNVGFLVTYNM